MRRIQQRQAAMNRLLSFGSTRHWQRAFAVDVDLPAKWPRMYLDSGGVGHSHGRVPKCCRRTSQEPGSIKWSRRVKMDRGTAGDLFDPRYQRSTTPS